MSLQQLATPYTVYAYITYCADVDIDSSTTLHVLFKTFGVMHINCPEPNHAYQCAHAIYHTWSQILAFLCSVSNDRDCWRWYRVLYIYSKHTCTMPVHVPCTENQWLRQKCQVRLSWIHLHHQVSELKFIADSRTSKAKRHTQTMVQHIMPWSVPMGHCYWSVEWCSIRNRQWFLWLRVAANRYDYPEFDQNVSNGSSAFTWSSKHVMDNNTSDSKHCWNAQDAI